MYGLYIHLQQELVDINKPGEGLFSGMNGISRCPLAKKVQVRKLNDTRCSAAILNSLE